MRPDRRVWLTRLAANHPAIAPSTAEHHASAASVCLARFHDVPPARLSVHTDDGRKVAELIWRYPTTNERASHANDEEATRDGAYGVVLAVVHKDLGLMTLGRAMTRSGSDWMLAPVGTSTELDFDRDDVLRLEVSGVSDDDDRKLADRVRRKVAQVSAATSPYPGIVGVAGFRSPTVVLKKV